MRASRYQPIENQPEQPIPHKAQRGEGGEPPLARHKEKNSSVPGQSPPSIKKDGHRSVAHQGRRKLENLCVARLSNP